jgi:heterodisulfide reductase subunit A2
MQNMKRKTIAVIGGGPAGLGAISALETLDADILLIDKSNRLGGHLNQWHRMNPTFTDAQTIIGQMTNHANSENMVVYQNTVAEYIEHQKTGVYSISTNNNKTLLADAVIFAGGFNEFDARKKEELGYGLYRRVVTSVEVEHFLAGNHSFDFAMSNSPNIGFVHCVGSRDVKCGNRYCSRICCMVGAKQAIKLKQKFPRAQITSFYMDLRMAGRGYEELYLQAQQEYSIRFVRGRVSEVSESQDTTLQVKAEDTLLARPIRGTFDLLVLLVGMEPPLENPLWTMIPKEADGFAKDELTQINPTDEKAAGLFWAGACKGPTTAADAFRDGQNAGLEAIQYLKSRQP